VLKIRSSISTNFFPDFYSFSIYFSRAENWFRDLIKFGNPLTRGARLAVALSAGAALPLALRGGGGV
jgi:hypothetical protein